GHGNVDLVPVPGDADRLEGFDGLSGADAGEDPFHFAVEVARHDDRDGLPDDLRGGPAEHRSAARFQVRTTPSRSWLMMASPDESTSAASRACASPTPFCRSVAAGSEAAGRRTGSFESS